MVCILYVIAIGTLLGMVGLLIERVLPPNTTSRRWIWCAVIAINMTIGHYSTHTSHRSPKYSENQVVPSHLGQRGRHRALTALNGGWAARIESLKSDDQRVWMIASGLCALGALPPLPASLFWWRASRRLAEADCTSIVDGVRARHRPIGPATVECCAHA